MLKTYIFLFETDEHDYDIVLFLWLFVPLQFGNDMSWWSETKVDTIV